MLDSPKEGTGSEELPLSNSHEQTESLWVKIKNRTSKRHPVFGIYYMLPGRGALLVTAALLQIYWQTLCIFKSCIQVYEDLKSIVLKIELFRTPLVTGHQSDATPFTIT